METVKNGKGDEPRPVNPKTYGSNFDDIFRKGRHQEDCPTCQGTGEVRNTVAVGRWSRESKQRLFISICNGQEYFPMTKCPVCYGAKKVWVNDERKA